MNELVLAGVNLVSVLLRCVLDFGYWGSV